MKHEFTKDGIVKMYDEVFDDCLKAIHKGTIKDFDIKIKIGNHEITIPNHADNLAVIFEAIEECEKITESE